MTEMPLQSEPLEIQARPAGRIAWGVFGYALLMAFMFLPPVAMFLPATIFNCDIRNGRRKTWLVFAMAMTIVGLGLAATALNYPGAIPEDLRLTYAYLAAEALALAL